MLASNANKDYCKSDKSSKRPECQKSTKSKAKTKNTGSKNHIDTSKTTHMINVSTKKSKSVSKPEGSKAVSKIPNKSTHFDTIDELRDIEITKGGDVFIRNSFLMFLIINNLFL